MVVITEVLVSAVMGQLVSTAYNYISTKIVDRFSKPEMNEQLGRIEKALPMIRTIVSVTEKGPVAMGEVDASLNAWLWQLRDAVDAANDLLDEIEYHKLDQSSGPQPKGSSSDSKGVKISCTPWMVKFPRKALKAVVSTDPILRKLQEVVKQLDDAASHVGEFIQITHLERADWVDKRLEIATSRETGSLPVDDKIFGRDEEKAELVAWLLSNVSQESSCHINSVPVATIVGVGGLGKTTLCQAIYNDARVKEHFSKTMWVCVSNVFDISLILTKIMEAASSESVTPIHNLSVLQETVKTKLAMERFLLVLDDVWDDEHRDRWEKLIAPLKCGQVGSKIVLTTRMGSVAKMARDVITGTGDHKQLLLKGLEDEELCLILRKFAFAGVNPKDHRDLQQIGNQIAKKLGGVPLLAKVMGGVLNSSLNYDHWRRILENDVMSLEGEDKIVEVLKLSYQNLPVKLHACFRFCSIYPEDHCYKKSELVGIWISLGLIQEPVTGSSQRLEDIAEEYLKEIVRKSLLEVRKYYNDEYYYYMHDCVHHMARVVAKEECWGAEDRDVRNIPKTVRHLFIKVEDLSLFQTLHPPRNLHTLIIIYSGDDPQFIPILDALLKNSPNLRALVLWCTYVKQLPLRIGELIHLRYLCIDSSIYALQTDHFRKLYHLQGLYLPHVHRHGFEDGKHIHKVKVPEAFSELRRLRHFYGGSNPVFFRWIGMLISLQEIGRFTVKDEDGYKLSELKHMNELSGVLEIVDLENVNNCKDADKAKLKEKSKLNSLILRWNEPPPEEKGRHETDAELLRTLEPPSQLNEITIDGYQGIHLPHWMVSQSLKHLVSVTFMNCPKMVFLPHFEWPYLLKSIYLQNLPAVVRIPPIPLSTERIEIKNVGLEYLPRLCQCSESNSENSSSLYALKIERCSNLRSLAEGLLQHPENLISLEHLEITKYDEVVDLPPSQFNCFTSLKHITLYLKSLQFHWITGKFFPASLVELKLFGLVRTSLPNLLCGLTSLCINGANVISLPTEEVLGELIALETIRLYDCKELTSLGGLNAVSSLIELEIRGCPKLEVVAFQMVAEEESSVSVGGLRKLKILYINSCGMLTLVENLCALFSLKELTIGNCPKLMALTSNQLSVDSADEINFSTEEKTLSLDEI